MFKLLDPFPGEVRTLLQAKMRVVTLGSVTRLEFDFKTPHRHSSIWTGLLLAVFLGLIVGLVVGPVRSQYEGITAGVIAGICGAGFLPMLVRASQQSMAEPIIELDAETKTLLLWHIERQRDLKTLDRLVLRMRRGQWGRYQSLGVSVHGIARDGGRELWVHSLLCTRGQTRELVDHLHSLCSPILPVVVESLVEGLKHPLEGPDDRDQRDQA